MGATRRFSACALCLVLAFGLAGILTPALAQQQEKRIALVVGNGAYGKSPLATAANDAGLIAQTLQAAGFDVIGARDLDGDTLRRTLRDFTQKAETSGPDTVAMIYLAGYGMQLAGENYFIPVDSGIGRETDIPTEGLRIGDYLRRLGTLPLKASIVVLDAARQQPFIEGGQPIAGGLALVEPEQRMLIAFNAAPGTVAPEEQGPYGAYAQSLAEMIRTGGLPLPELFDRVRLRVNENSKGAQVPWHAQKLDTGFMFFDRAPDAPSPATSDRVASVRNKPIRDLGVRDAYAAALERDTLQGYDEFVAAYPGDPMARRVRALAAARREAITWMRTYRTDTPQAYWSYLRRYPNGPHAADARRRLAILTAPLEPPPSFAVIDYDVPPPPPEEIVYVDRPVVMFSDPYYGFAPPPPPPVYFLPPPPPEFVVLEPPPPPIGLFILPQPVFVAMPLYVRAPVYVAPPPNNVIFANIHNTTVINNVINRPPVPPPGGAPGSAPLGARSGPPVAAAGAAAPALPPSVAQRATLIQEGKAPLPPSAAINSAVVRPGAPTGPGSVAPSMLPANAPAATPQGQQLPKANALPVPGTKGAPPLPPAGTAGTPTVNPNARTGTLSAPPSGTLPAATAPGTPATTGLPRVAPTNPPASVVGTPKAGGTPPATGMPPRPGSAALTPASSSPSSGAAGAPPSRPAGTSAGKPAPGVAPSARTAPPLPSQASRAAVPPQPPRVSAPPPPARVATPSPPPARVSAPPPPPPRVSAPPPPPPRMTAPPPAARVAAPPPPPPPRMAAPPPPRPVAPPPVAAKRCPPNVPKC